MKSPPPVPNEAARLEALHAYRVLDTAAEEDFDDLTALAADIVGTPIALVSLVDQHRQWFKSHHGLDASETPREVAFCAHAIAQSEPLVVSDSHRDERFHDNPLVTGFPGVRFYAGVKLENPQGHALGTLCVIDHEARELPPEKLRALQRLGRQVVAQLELRRARDQAIQSAAAKGEFLANVSHEIRTPLNGVIGLTELLLETQLQPVQRERAEAIRDCGQHLLVVVNDVLDFSKLEAGKARLNVEPFELRTLVERSISMAAGPATAKGVEVELDWVLRGPSRRLGDATRIRQIVLNLVGNAVKFTPRGKVTIRVEDAAAGAFKVSVVDSGIGIPEDRLARLFERFVQAEASTARKFGGTGLGLAISRALVEQMGGQIGAESVAGQGSTFWFELPLPVANPESPRAPETRGPERPVTLGGLRVLVAEDNQVNQLLIQRLLTRLGCEPVLVADGAAALRAWESTTFDLILMDCQMPGLDGFEATAHIRASGRPDARRVPIVALTASALDEDRDRCLEAGMDDFLSKPVAPDLLEATLHKFAALLRAA